MRYIVMIAAWKPASLAWIQHNQSINLSNSLSNTTPNGYRAATGMRPPLPCVLSTTATSDYGNAYNGEKVPYQQRARRGMAPAEYLESTPPLRPIYGRKWNTTVLPCRQRRRRRGGHREQVVWRRYGIANNCYHYASYCFKHFCSLAVRLLQRTVVTVWRPTLRKIIHIIQNKLDHMTQFISFRAEESLG